MAGMGLSLLVMILLSQWTWQPEAGGLTEVPRVGWPWYTLIGTGVAMGACWALDRLAPRARPPAPGGTETG